MRARSKQQRRTGAAIALALTMVAVTGLLVGAMLNRSVREQRQMRLTWNQWQARWLARSAVERARYQIAQDVKYDGEAWFPTIENAAPSATIKIEKNDRGSQISVAVSYPSDDSAWRVQSTLRQHLKSSNSR